MATKQGAHRRPGKSNSLRIIGGQWRGRKLKFPDTPGLRPTGDRLRETLFNWLTPIIADAHCLDLFAGSGALGLEAVSRGANSALLVEQSPVACKALKQHRQTLCAENQLQIIQADALQWLRQSPPQTFDILFLDPPFNSQLLPAAIRQLSQTGWLSAGAHVYIESPRQRAPTCPNSWRLLRVIETGQVLCQLFESRQG